METLTVGCLKILLLMPLDSTKCLNLLALWEGKWHFKLNDGVNQSSFWATSFHGGDGRAWAASLPKHWAALGTEASLMKIYGLASPGISILDEYAEAVHCVAEDKAPKRFLFIQAFEDLAKWSIFTCPPAISSHWHAVSLLPVPWRYLQASSLWQPALSTTHHRSKAGPFGKQKGNTQQRLKLQTLERKRAIQTWQLRSALTALAYKVSSR